MHINHRKPHNKSSLLNQSKEPYIIIHITILYAYSNDLMDSNCANSLHNQSLN